MALELTEERRHGKRPKRHVAIRIEAIDCLDERQRSDLDQIVRRLRAADIAPRQTARERQKPLDQRLASRRVTGARAPKQSRHGAVITLGPRRMTFVLHAGVLVRVPWVPHASRLSWIWSVDEQTGLSIMDRPVCPG